MRISNGCSAGRNDASGPASSRPMLRWPMALIAAIALPVAAGSVASAASNIAGRSPRISLREKSGGITRTNWTVPSASIASPSFSPAGLSVISK